jgi:alpha-glucosidase
MWPEAPPSTAGHHPRALELHLFVPARDGVHRSFLQEDDGETDAARDGARLRTSLEVTRSANRLELRAGVEGDGYPEFAREELHLVVHGAAPASATVGGETVAGEDGRFRLPNAGTPFWMDLEL